MVVVAEQVAERRVREPPVVIRVGVEPVEKRDRHDRARRVTSDPVKLHSGQVRVGDVLEHLRANDPSHAPGLDGKRTQVRYHVGSCGGVEVNAPHGPASQVVGVRTVLRPEVDDGPPGGELQHVRERPVEQPP